MSHFDELPTLLPYNASLLIQSLTELLTTPDNTQLIREIWLPERCPSELLPWLAWALSVDDWNDAWPEQTKRKVIDDAFVIHQFKATPFALKKALDSLNIETELHEWWHQDNAQQGTITVNALINENLDGNEEGLLTKSMLAQVKRIIDTVKRASIHVQVQLGISLKEQFGMGIHAGAGIGLLSKEGEFNGVRPDASQLDLSVSCNGQIGLGALQTSADFNGVTPDHAQAHIGVVMAAKSGIGTLVQSSEINGVVPDQSEASLNVGAYGQVNITALEKQADWLGVTPNTGAVSTGISGALSQLQFNHFTLQGAT